MLARRLARPLLGSIFVVGGLDAALHPRGKTPAAQAVATFLREHSSAPVPDLETLVRADGIAKVIAGTGLSLGRAPRLSAAVLSASMVPTTLAAHAFWKVEDPDGRAKQKIQFFKNLSILGGCLLAAVDTAGKPSVGWRARRAGRRLSRSVNKAAENTTESAERVARRTRKALPV